MLLMLQGPCSCLITESPFKNDKKCFLIHVQYSFCSWGIYNFVLTLCYIEKLRLTSKCMTSQTGQQMLTIQILDNISRHKGSQAMKSGQ